VFGGVSRVWARPGVPAAIIVRVRTRGAAMLIERLFSKLRRIAPP
jgi:hypothetical protein